MMRVVVTGGRYFNDEALVIRALGQLHQTHTIATLIHGDAPGADRLCAFWAMGNDVPVEAFRCDWTNMRPPVLVKYRRDGSAYNALAGFARNQDMIDFGRPDYGVAFPGGRGTADMVSRIELAGLPLWDLRGCGPP